MGALAFHLRIQAAGKTGCSHMRATERRPPKYSRSLCIKARTAMPEGSQEAVERTTSSNYRRDRAGGRSFGGASGEERGRSQVWH